MMHLLFALLMFSHPKVQKAAAELTQPECQYVNATEGVFRIEKGTEYLRLRQLDMEHPSHRTVDLQI
jgi:hypothetical protein